MNTNSALTRSYVANPFWYQQFDLRQIKILRGDQQSVDFLAAVNCRIHVTTLKAMKFQVDIPSIPIDKFKDHNVLVAQLIPMQVANGNCHYPKLVGIPMRAEPNFTFPLEHLTGLFILAERMSSIAVDKFGVGGKTSKTDNVSLQQKITRILLLKYWYCCSFRL